MKNKRIVGIALIIVGAIMLFFSSYIAERIASGQMQITQAQGKVDSANSLFGMSKYTKPIGKQFTGSAQNQINAGQSEIDRYQSISANLKIGGIILIIIGIALLYFSRKRK